MLEKTIAIHKIFQVSDDLHARFNAKLRTYKYFIHFEKDPLKRHLLWISQDVDLDLMNKAAGLLVGTMDFEAFSKKHTDVKTHLYDKKSPFYL